MSTHKEKKTKIGKDLFEKLESLKDSTRKYRLTEEQKEAIIKFYPTKKRDEIAAVMGVSGTTITRFYKRYLFERGITEEEHYKEVVGNE